MRPPCSGISPAQQSRAQTACNQSPLLNGAGNSPARFYPISSARLVMAARSPLLPAIAAPRERETTKSTSLELSALAIRLRFTRTRPLRIALLSLRTPPPPGRPPPLALPTHPTHP